MRIIKVCERETTLISLWPQAQPMQTPSHLYKNSWLLLTLRELVNLDMSPSLWITKERTLETTSWIQGNINSNNHISNVFSYFYLDIHRKYQLYQFFREQYTYIHTYIHTSFHIPQKVSLRNNIHTNLPENLRNAVFPNISTALTSFKIQDNERYRTHWYSSCEVVHNLDNFTVFYCGIHCYEIQGHTKIYFFFRGKINQLYGKCCSQ